MSDENQRQPGEDSLLEGLRAFAEHSARRSPNSKQRMFGLLGQHMEEIRENQERKERLGRLREWLRNR